jgi:hypothetical protein
MWRWVAVVILGVALAPLARGEEAKPKFGPDAVPITQGTGYLRTGPAPDYWKLAAFYVPQTSSSGCSVASVAMALNFIRGLPTGADEPLVTQAALLEAVGDPDWVAKTAEGGEGVLFQELVGALTKSLDAYALHPLQIDVIRPTDASPESLERLRAVLAANEASESDVILLYFNQGVLTGDWDGPHISPIGAYDDRTDRVLIMDVDREWYVPYWSPVSKLLDAMLRPAPAEQGPLAGETGGLVWLKGG